MVTIYVIADNLECLWQSYRSQYECPIFEPTCAYARRSHMHRFASVKKILEVNSLT